MTHAPRASVDTFPLASVNRIAYQYLPGGRSAVVEDVRVNVSKPEAGDIVIVGGTAVLSNASIVDPLAFWTIKSAL